MEAISKKTTGKWYYITAVFATTLVVFLAIYPFQKEDASWFAASIGNLHPLLVHLPIGMLIALFAFEFLQLFKPSMQMGDACLVLLWLVALTSLPTVIAGVMLSVAGNYGSDAFVVHKWLGVATTVMSFWMLALKSTQGESKRFSVYHTSLISNVAILSIAGHFGGTLTHGSNFLTKDLPEDVRALLGDDPYSLDGLEEMEATLVSETLEKYDYHKNIAPITTNYCTGCHGEEKQKAGLRLDEIDPDLIHGKDAETWRAMLDLINSGEMPPKDEPQLSDEERRVLVDWITASVQQAVAVRKAEEKPVIGRLTKHQYTNSLKEILQVPVNFGDKLPDDAKSEMGFSNNNKVLQVSPLHIDYYKQIAREALDKAIAPSEKPAPTHYRITFGKGIGKGQPAGKIGGFQSAPIDPDNFVIDILDEQGNPKVGLDSLEQAKIEEIKKNIGVGMRGSTADRYEVVDEGIILYSALPHREVTPKSWQGPSPNLKLLFRDYFPETGPFRLRVKASKGYQWYTQKEGFIALRKNLQAENLEEKIILDAASNKLSKNLEAKGNMFIPQNLTEESNAVFTFEAPQDGYYQFDFEHPYAGVDAMPSIRFNVDRHKLQERLHIDSQLVGKAAIQTPITLAYFKKGEHKLQIGGKFFIGFSKVIITHFKEAHPLAQKLKAEAEENRAKYNDDMPVMKAFAGSRTDDGMDYKTFDTFKNITTPLGKWDTYTFSGQLENLPIPAIDTVETEILANIMILGVWNDFLVKDNHDSGPPLLINQLEFEAPYYPVWPPKSHTDIFFASENKDNLETYTEEVVSEFMERAFRRPLQEGELTPYMDFWRAIKDDYPRYEDSVKEVLIAILCSPKFLYFAEPEKETSEKEKQYFLASKLSYFLWNAPPDEELIALASDEDLNDEDELKKQVKRMLQDDKIWQMVRQFTNEWLRVDRHENMNVNVRTYPDFTRFVKQDMVDETYHFMHHVLQKDQSIFNLIDSDFAMLNQNLAEFYGIEGVKGSHFRPVKVNAQLRRGGLLSQGAFLSGHSDGTQAHAIKRAVWLQAKILGNHPPAPPPNVPELDPETPGFELLTLKEQLFLHREKAACMDCHKKIDPYGIVFENYDAVGRYQTVAMEKPIDTKAELPDGQAVEGIEGIKSYILDIKSDDFTRSLVKHLFAYALGRDVTFVDEKEIDEIVRNVKRDDYRFQSVIENIVVSPSFKGKDKKITLWGSLLN